jgi:hypothetical protein
MTPEMEDLIAEFIANYHPQPPSSIRKVEFTKSLKHWRHMSELCYPSTVTIESTDMLSEDTSFIMPTTCRTCDATGVPLRAFNCGHSRCYDCIFRVYNQELGPDFNDCTTCAKFMDGLLKEPERITSSLRKVNKKAVFERSEGSDSILPSTVVPSLIEEGTAKSHALVEFAHDQVSKCELDINSHHHNNQLDSVTDKNMSAPPSVLGDGAEKPRGLVTALQHDFEDLCNITPTGTDHSGVLPGPPPGYRYPQNRTCSSSNRGLYFTPIYSEIDDNVDTTRSCGYTCPEDYDHYTSGVCAAHIQPPDSPGPHLPPSKPDILEETVLLKVSPSLEKLNGTPTEKLEAFFSAPPVRQQQSSDIMQAGERVDANMITEKVEMREKVSFELDDEVFLEETQNEPVRTGRLTLREVLQEYRRARAQQQHTEQQANKHRLLAFRKHQAQPESSVQIEPEFMNKAVTKAEFKVESKAKTVF